MQNENFHIYGGVKEMDGAVRRNSSSLRFNKRKWAYRKRGLQVVTAQNMFTYLHFIVIIFIIFIYESYFNKVNGMYELDFLR